MNDGNIREWWIEKFGLHWRSCGPFQDAVHVIEYSAFDQMRKERDELKATLEHTVHISTYSKLLDERTALKKGFEYLVSMLPEECTAGFVTHARAIISMDKNQIEKTK